LYFTLFIIAKRYSDLNLLAFELDLHVQFKISKFFLRTSSVLIPSYLKVFADEKVHFEVVEE
jgi:hypothetical protein